MNFIYGGIFILYALVLLGFGVYDSRRVKDFSDYVVAGRSRGSIMVAASLLATVVGASATMGVVSLAGQAGLPAFWWLGSGAVFLFLSSRLIGGMLSGMGVFTLPHLAERLFGGKIYRLIALLIVIGWSGIVAAQFVAGAKIVATFTGLTYSLSLLLVVLLIVLYTILGGQLSIFRTDLIQALLLFGGIFLTLILLLNQAPALEEIPTLAGVMESFPLSRWAYFTFIVGSAFFVGPDIFSRFYSARDPRSARVGGTLAAGSLLLFSGMITLIGVWGNSNLPGVEGDRLLTVILAEHLPPVLGLLLALGLFSAIVSSADTCLMSATSTLENDLVGRRVVKENRLLVLVLGGAAGVIAYLRPGIIPNLMLAYNLFSCGAIPPMAMALLRLRFREKDDFPLLHPLAAGLAVITGGSLGMASSILHDDLLALAGFTLSLLFSLAGIFILRKKS